MKVILDAGADPNVPASDGQASIHSAYNTLSKLRLLAGHGANLNLESERADERGWTPIMPMAGHSSWPLARFPAENGVDLDHRAPGGITLDTILERFSDTDKSAPDYLAMVEAIRTRRAQAL